MRGPPPLLPVLLLAAAAAAAAAATGVVCRDFYGNEYPALSGQPRAWECPDPGNRPGNTGYGPKHPAVRINGGIAPPIPCMHVYVDGATRRYASACHGTSGNGPVCAEFGSDDGPERQTVSVDRRCVPLVRAPGPRIRFAAGGGVEHGLRVDGVWKRVSLDVIVLVTGAETFQPTFARAVSAGGEDLVECVPADRERAFRLVTSSTYDGAASYALDLDCRLAREPGDDYFVGNGILYGRPLEFTEVALAVRVDRSPLRTSGAARGADGPLRALLEAILPRRAPVVRPKGYTCNLAAPGFEQVVYDTCGTALNPCRDEAGAVQANLFLECPAQSEVNAYPWMRNMLKDRSTNDLYSVCDMGSYGKICGRCSPGSSARPCSEATVRVCRPDGGCGLGAPQSTAFRFAEPEIRIEATQKDKRMERTARLVLLEGGSPTATVTRVAVSAASLPSRYTVTADAAIGAYATDAIVTVGATKITADAPVSETYYVDVGVSGSGSARLRVAINHSGAAGAAAGPAALALALACAAAALTLAGAASASTPSPRARRRPAPPP